MKKLFIALSLLLTGCVSTQASESKLPFIFVDDKVLYLELGDQETQFSNEDVFNQNSNKDYFENAILDYSSIDRNVLGTYSLNISFSEDSGVDKKMMIDVVVRDTVSPTLEVKDVHVTEGDAVDVNSFVVEAKDLQTVELTFKEEVDLASVGTRSYTLVAKDASGNVTEKTVNLTVEAKPAVNNWTPSNNGGGSSWTPPVNGGGGGTTPAPTPGPTPAPTVVGGYDCAGDYWTCFAKMETWANSKYASTGWFGDIVSARMSDGSYSEYYWVFSVTPW